ncbi:helix-turn-helix transcriptional regulator [Halobacteriovorax sp. JY17]|uniref:helix-turn-helix domain-containing protein n=1 Tax=Halobacteriovorax sp. JY17 TaxID=2014617 RepID=UPI000C4FCE69|nr:helix-turn-helix transcriptional regulator [Halobacteriovorax sp. JY17]PIK14658.1 MAG: hypothetical protein CES88_09980 [Halobacteriovorax sp. JY17]
MRRKDNAEILLRELYEKLEVGEIELPDAIRSMRKTMGITQENFSKMIGVDKRVLAGFENGSGNPTLKIMNKILGVFGLKLTARRP